MLEKTAYGQGECQMATSKVYLQFILDQLSGLEGITYRTMMGKYILYYHSKIAASVHKVGNLLGKEDISTLSKLC